MKKLFLLLFIFLFFDVFAEDGYRLWLRYDLIRNNALLQQYRNDISGVQFAGTSPTLTAAKEELINGLEGMLGKKIPQQTTAVNGSLVAGTPGSSALIRSLIPEGELNNLGKEGFIIRATNNGGKKMTVVTANTDVGVLYGVFHFLRLMQTNQSIQNLSITSIPKIQHRVLNHWDNLNRTVERGYAGFSIWNWHTLPDYIDQRYIDYARANASVGINGTVLTNVNANALVLTKEYLVKVAALANVFRPYGIRVYLTARFSAPIEIGGLKTADPLDTAVQNWWKRKTDEVYQYIPDFGGFLVKANSEGQPGPQNYGRSHADGANMLADAVAPHGGIVMWRAFVYSNEVPEDRVKQAYSEFKPLDGKFRNNVLVQVKNGPLDFQPREPFSPLFGAMPQTPLMMEFQITQEYLGQGTNLVYEAPLFKEVLDVDTWQKGKGSTVAKVIDGSLHHYQHTGMAGVANIGNERNWTGHPFGQANWYAFGRLAWDHDLSSEQIADEWIRQTFTNNITFVATTKKIMLSSHQTIVNYMTPLGLHHSMGTGHHYGPAPWVSNAGRADWNPVYYHRADSIGIGFDRTEKGSNALEQYAPEVRKMFEDMNTCPEDYLLWFHHVPWNYKMKSGRTLWEELCYKYYAGVDSVRAMQQQWNSLKGLIDDERFRQVQMLLNIQEKEALWWRNACVQYFQTLSKRPIPAGLEKPDYTLDYYRSLRFPFAPGIGGSN
ncbi:MAG: alpha-glucuronidase [Flavisolibacter sp.]|nr:alpha-glucuronidase [Flavisolibacter sp.]